MSTPKQKPIIWINELQWFSRVNIQSTTSNLSLWQSILYIMKKNRIAMEEAKHLEQCLRRLEDKALAQYIEEATEAGDILRYAPPKKRSAKNAKPKSSTEIPPKEPTGGDTIVHIEGKTHLRQLMDDERQEQKPYLDALTISLEDALSWLKDLEEARRELLSDLPVAISIHAFLVAEIKKAKAFRHQEQTKVAHARNKIAPKTIGKTSHLRVPPMKPAEQSVLEMEWNDVLTDYPLPSISKASLRAWPMVVAFEFLQDPERYISKQVTETTKTVNGTIKALLLYLREASLEHKTDDGKVEPYQVAKSLAEIAEKQKQWAPSVATMTNHLKRFIKE